MLVPVGPFLRVPTGGSTLDPCRKPLGAQNLSSVCGPAKTLWVDASQEAYTDGQKVATIHDFSGNANNFTQATPANQATFRTTLATGGPVFNFDSQIEGYLTAAGAAAGDTTTHIVVRYLLGQSGFATEVWGWQAVGGGPGYILDGSVGSPGGLLGISGGFTVAAVCGWQVVTIVNHSAGAYDIYRNGALLGSGGVGNNHAPTTFNLGSGTPGTALGAVMQLAEIQHIAAAETAMQVATDASCLKSKWGVP